MGEYDAVSAAQRFAVLSDQITELSQRVDELASSADEARQQRDRDRQDIEAGKTAVAKWNARVDVEVIGPVVSMRNAIKQLREKVDGLAATLDQGKVKAPSAPRWDNLDQEQEAAQLAALRQWVNGVLRVQYPGYTLPDCWADHREALWELGALYAEWLRVFGGQHGVNLENMLWFHERWLPGTIGRLNKAIKPDGSWCRTHHGAYPQRAAGW